MKRLMITWRFCTVFVVFLTLSPFYAQAPARQADSASPPEWRNIFVSGQDAYGMYRIPSLLVTRSGTLLAFCEGRRNGSSDTGDIDVLVKRSSDGGRTWSAQQVIWDDGPNTCGNPTALVDRDTGRVWLLLTHNLGSDHESEIIRGESKGTRTVWVTYSDDDGRSWAPPREITATTKDPSWGWYATGPGVGIQIRKGPFAGRLVVPANHSYRSPEGAMVGGGYEYRAHVIYSDDGGATWKRSQPIGPQCNESQLVELVEPAGRLLMNMRNYNRDAAPARAIASSDDGGATWSAVSYARELISPICQASILRYSWPKGEEPGLLLFSNPADTTKRQNMTVRVSRDDAQSWTQGRIIDPGFSGYSSLAALPDGTVGLLYEGRLEPGHYDQGVLVLRFTRFPLDWFFDTSNGFVTH